MGGEPDAGDHQQAAAEDGQAQSLVEQDSSLQDGENRDEIDENRSPGGADAFDAIGEPGEAEGSAADGEEGLGLALEAVHDVLIVDRMLPKIDGLTIVRKLREHNIKTPVLILSALADVDERVKGLRAGGDDYLGKPYDEAELLGLVAGYCKKAD